MADSVAQSTALKDIVRDASMLREKRLQLDTLRMDHAKEWALNREFYRGNQWVFWNRNSNRVESLGVDEADKPRYKVRLTLDQIKPATQQLVAMMTKTRPTMHAVPSGSSNKDVQAAKMGEDLFKHWWTQFGLTGKLQSALTNAQISQGYWLITWDPLAGTPFDVMLNPQTGQPITDDRLADLMKEEIEGAAQQHGVDPAQVLAQVEKRLYLGDIKVQVLSGEQVWLLGTGTNFEDCTGAICRYAMDVDEVQARWGVRVNPDATTSENSPVLAGTKGKDDQLPKNAKNVYVGYFKPQPALPKGRYVVWIETPNKILYEGDWDFPTHDLPLVKFPGIENDRSVYDFTRIEMARPMQKELNNTVSKIAMYKNLGLKPQVLAPIGSLRQRLTDEPGAVVEYSPVGGMAPEWRPAPQLPAWVFEYLGQIQSRLDRVFNLMPTERSQLPARTDSGNLVDLIQEAVADQITPEIRRMEEALAQAGNLMDALAQKYYVEPRLMAITGEGGSVRSKSFMRSTGTYTFHAEAGSGLPRTRAGQMQQLKEMIEMQVISPADALPYMPIAGLKTIQDRLAADEDQALRETDKLIQGVPTNPGAYQQAIQLIEAGEPNPDTGEPFEYPGQQQQYLLEQALSPLTYEDLQTHMRIHAQYMKTEEFEAQPPDVQQRFVQHYMLTRQLFFSLPAHDPHDMRVSLGLTGTVGPTVAAAILRNKGIMDATPEAMQEPPLETRVQDDVWQAPDHAEGNQQLTQQEQLHNMEMQSEAHGLATAKASADASLAARRVGAADAQHANAQDVHAVSQAQKLQQMRHAEEMHQARLKAAAAAAAHKQSQKDKPKNG